MEKGFLEYYLSWSSVARRAYAAGAGALLPPAYYAVDTVLVCGMGGSGVAGLYLEALSKTYGGVPVYSCNCPYSPAWAHQALVYAVSFSGNTVETLNCAVEAYRRGARVVAVTTGGRLAAWARSTGLPVLIVEEAPAPRAGWPQLFYTLLGSLRSAGMLQAPESDVEESLRLLDSREEALGEADRLASWVTGGQHVVLVAPEPYYPVALRARSEFAENTKLYIEASELPEAGHNLLEAWASSGKPIDFVAVDPGEEPWTSLLAEALALARPASIHTWRLRGRSPLARMVWGTWVAGLASIKAALARGVDPEKLTAVKAFRGVVEKTAGWGASGGRAGRQ